MRLQLTVFGREVCTFDVTRSDPAEVLAEAIAGLVGDSGEVAEPDEEEPTTGGNVCGGSSHNFERDDDPHDPNDRYAPWEDKRRLGFH